MTTDNDLVEQLIKATDKTSKLFVQWQAANNAKGDADKKRHEAMLAHRDAVAVHRAACEAENAVSTAWYAAVRERGALAAKLRTSSLLRLVTSKG